MQDGARHVNKQAIQEATLRLTVLMEAPSPEAAESILASMSLQDLTSEMDQGDFIGASTIAGIRQVAPGQVARRLKAVGNDGSFFSGAAADSDELRRDADMEILSMQIRQGWSSETLMALAGSFLREAGLQQAFLSHLEGAARFENEENDPEEPEI